MRLSELVSTLTPSELTEIALVVFVAVFVVIIARQFRRTRAAEHAACAALPLADDVAPPAGPGHAQSAHLATKDVP